MFSRMEAPKANLTLISSYNQEGKKQEKIAIIFFLIFELVVSIGNFEVIMMKKKVSKDKFSAHKIKTSKYEERWRKII